MTSALIAAAATTMTSCDDIFRDAPINKIADFAITGDLNEVIPKMIKYYKQNSK